MPTLSIDESESSIVEESDTSGGVGNCIRGVNISNNDSEEEMPDSELFATLNDNDGEVHAHDNLVKSIFLLLGIGFLLPWNAFISATAYFENRICSADSRTLSYTRQWFYDGMLGTEAESDGESNGDGGGKNNFMLWFSFIYNFSGLMTLGLMLALQKRNGSAENTNANSSLCTDQDQVDGPIVGENEGTGPVLEPLLESSNSERSARKRQWRMIVIAFTFFLTVIIITASLVLVPVVEPFLFEFVSLTSAAVCGISGAFISAGIVSFANIFPPMIGVQPYITGQAVGGVVTSILKMVLSSMMGKNGVDVFWESHCRSGLDRDEYDPNIDSSADWIKNSEQDTALSSTSSSCPQYHIDWGAFGYFFIGGLCISSCIGLFIYLDRHPVTEYYRDLQGKGKVGAHTNQSQPSEANNGNISRESSHIINMDTDRHEVVLDQEMQLHEPLLGDAERVEERNDAATNMERQTSTSNQYDLMSTVWRKIRNPAVSVFVTLFITIMIFPSWVTKFESVKQCMDRENRLRNDLYIPAFIVLFNVFDFYGRSASGWVDLSGYSDGTLRKKLARAMLARFVFLPIFLLFRVSGSALVPPLKVFYNDWCPFAFTILFAFTNGFIMTLSFFQAAILTPKTDEAQQISSTILNFAVAGGLVCGSLFSFIYNYIGTGRW